MAYLPPLRKEKPRQHLECDGVLYAVIRSAKLGYLFNLKAISTKSYITILTMVNFSYAMKAE